MLDAYAYQRQQLDLLKQSDVEEMQRKAAHLDAALPIIDRLLSAPPGSAREYGAKDDLWVWRERIRA